MQSVILILPEVDGSIDMDGTNPASSMGALDSIHQLHAPGITSELPEMPEEQLTSG